MKAAIYARTAHSEQSTLSQIELCREYIREQKGTVVGVYDDEGSSAHDDDRDGLASLMTDALTTSFDTVVVTGYDRLFRSHGKLQEFINQLGALKIELVAVKSL
ncbi:recombinase family protein [Paenibacillus mesophilus]|uniref:recombinase family protein n=1 Tax=Paenibacillus mesophilus TaxID=2582849 RepID=UPI00110D8314|nr:recombinase family protein [Paenibacillus mesophilus]TMV49405.1 recombinase family protein [Paenibacillus mesophilus]